MRPTVQHASALTALPKLSAASFGFRESLPRSVVPTPSPALNALLGGLPRGAITEITGKASSGRTSFVLSCLAQLTQQGEHCAYIDASDRLSPAGAQQAGIHLPALLWVRCQGYGEQPWRAVDLLLQSGFGAVVLDATDMPSAEFRRLPLSTWYRFRNAVEKTQTLLLVMSQRPRTQSCGALLLEMEQEQAAWSSPQPEQAFLRHLQCRITARRPRPCPPVSWRATLRE